MPVPSATITLGGEPRTLEFTPWAILCYARAKGIAPEDIVWEEVIRFENLFTLVWAMLDETGQAELPTPEKLMRSIAPEELEEVREAVGPVVAGSLPEREGGGAAAGKAKGARRRARA